MLLVSPQPNEHTKLRIFWALSKHIPFCYCKAPNASIHVHLGDLGFQRDERLQARIIIIIIWRQTIPMPSGWVRTNNYACIAAFIHMQIILLCPGRYMQNLNIRVRELSNDHCFTGDPILINTYICLIAVLCYMAYPTGQVT